MMRYLRGFLTRQRGEIVNLVIGIVIVLLVMALLLPIALRQWFAVNTTSIEDWGLTTLWPVLPLVAVVAIVIVLVRRVGSGGGGSE